MSFKNKTVIITGGTRGIGKAMGLKLAAEGANIVIAAKSVEENPKLGGTIFSAAAEMEAAGGKALAVQCDIRFEDQVQNVIDKAVETFGGIDILINNASYPSGGGSLNLLACLIIDQASSPLITSSTVKENSTSSPSDVSIKEAALPNG